MDYSKIFEVLCTLLEHNNNTKSSYEKLLWHLLKHNPNFPKDFSSLPTNYQKVNFVHENLQNFISAVYEKELGNKFFGKGEYKEAWECYTKSIALSENKSENLGIAYANRSAVLQKFGLHKECLEDIKRALNNNYPEKLKPKLIDRQKKSKALLKSCKINSYYEPIEITNKHPLIQSAADCVEIKVNQKYGRYVVASKDIEIGTVLVVEKPFVSVVQNDQKLSHCHECTELCYNLIPCDSCTKALYCSEKCKIKAFKAYHKYECRILLTIMSNPDIESHVKLLSLKLLFLIRDELGNLDKAKVSIDEEYRSDRYKEIYYLISHCDKRDDGNIFSGAFIAALFYNLVKNHTIFFNGLEDAENTYKEIILLHLMSFVINNIAIRENVIDKDTVIGSGVYSFSSIFSHSCYCNVMYSSHGSAIVLRSIQSIKKGEQLFINYCKSFEKTSKEDRQIYLKRYFFNCSCVACRNNWPLFENLSISSYVSSMLLLQCHLLDFKKEKDINLYMQIFIDELKKNGTRNPPCMDIVLLENILKRYFFEQGNKRLF